MHSESNMNPTLVFSCIILFVNLLNEGCTSPVASAGYSTDYFDKIINDVKNAGAPWEVC